VRGKKASHVKAKVKAVKISQRASDYYNHDEGRVTDVAQKISP